MLYEIDISTAPQVLDDQTASLRGWQTDSCWVGPGRNNRPGNPFWRLGGDVCVLCHLLWRPDDRNRKGNWRDIYDRYKHPLCHNVFWRCRHPVHAELARQPVVIYQGIRAAYHQYRADGQSSGSGPDFDNPVLPRVFRCGDCNPQICDHGLKAWRNSKYLQTLRATGRSVHGPKTRSPTAYRNNTG